MNLTILRIGLFAVLLAACMTSGCSGRLQPAPDKSLAQQPPKSGSPNAAIVDEVNRAGSWFHARKVRPIRARKLEQDQTVETLEGPVQAKAGAYLCRGEAGEPWPQSAESLHERYLETDDVDAEGWREFTPRLDAEGILAARIDHPFTVQATWGPLKGKSGDYLLKKFADRDVSDPEDVWIVDATLFQATYAAVDEPAESPPDDSADSDS
jgi:hypothetical protein